MLADLFVDMILKIDLTLTFDFSHEDDKVNIEVDVLAKMVERSLSGVYENNSKYANSVETIAKLEERVEALESTILKMQKDIAFLLLK